VVLRFPEAATELSRSNMGPICPHRAAVDESKSLN
jgi:hypothetical protein